MESAYITHNHPKSEGIVSFGEDDFIFPIIRKEKGQSPQGRITISDSEIQEIINNKCGTGKQRIRKDGNVANVEYVNVGRVVGKCFVNGQWVDTKRIAIHYGKSGSHIVQWRIKMINIWD